MGWVDDTAGLSEQGKQDAKSTAAKLASYQIDATYYSDLLRTTETANIITSTLQLSGQPTHLLRERNLGNFAGRTYHDIKTNSHADWDKFLDHHDPDWNGLEGESLRDMHKRFDQFMQKLKTKHPDQTVLLITHSGFMHTILRDYFEFFPKESFIEVGHSSLTILEKSGDKYELKAHNA